jgi:hypothetical protein
VDRDLSLANHQPIVKPVPFLAHGVPSNAMISPVSATIRGPNAALQVTSSDSVIVTRPSVFVSGVFAVERDRREDARRGVSNDV